MKYVITTYAEVHFQTEVEVENEEELSERLDMIEADVEFGISEPAGSEIISFSINSVRHEVEE